MSRKIAKERKLVTINVSNTYRQHVNSTGRAKKTFGSETEAWRVLNQDLSDRESTVYRCPICNHWHIGR